MRQRFHSIAHLMKDNLKPLVLFEVMYRFFGVVIIGPILYWLFMFSIRLAGYTYITHRAFLSYVFQPSTLMVGLVAAMIIVVYITFELIVLTVCFHDSKSGRKHTLSSLMITSGIKLKALMKKRRFGVFIVVFFFIFAVHSMHVVGVVQTLQLPVVIREQLLAMPWFYPTVALVTALGIIVFFKMVFALPHMVIHNKSFIHARKQGYRHLNQRKHILEGLIINGVLNIVLYSVYAVMMFIAGGAVYVAATTVVVGRVLLSVVVTIYAVFGFIASMCIIPINVAWVVSSQKQSSQAIEVSSPKPLLLKPIQRYIIGLVMLIVVIMNALTVNAAIREVRAPIDALNQPLVIAHRGSSLRAPENTIASIDLALEERADAVEFDIRITSDGKAVLMHDVTIGRTTNISTNQAINATSFDTLRALDAGSWFSEDFKGEQVPTLEEALRRIQGEAIAHVELKVSTPALEAELVTLLRDLDMVQDTIVYAFDPEILQNIKALDEDIETLLLLAAFYGNVSALLDYDFVDGYGVSYGLLTARPDAFQGLREAGKFVYVWTINDRPRMQDAIDIGVDGIITDDPLKAHDVIKTYETPSRIPALLENLFGQ